MRKNARISSRPCEDILIALRGYRHGIARISSLEVMPAVTNPKKKQYEKHKICTFFITDWG